MNSGTPLAERMRPKDLDDYIGQKHILGKDKPLRKLIEAGGLHSMVLWGPPGVGKTTLAHIITNSQKRKFFWLSAVNAGVKQIREVIDQAERSIFMGQKNAVLFIDEIHRFNKSQQDSLLASVEKGIITLIGATTENPSFEVNAALLSRCEVYVLESLAKDELEILLNKAIVEDEELKRRDIVLKETDALILVSGGDARKLLNALEIVVNSIPSGPVEITNELVLDVVPEKVAIYDKAGEQHYDIVSAFIKSIRGSDPNAALYWLARMIEGGEDPKFIARRLLILASEDIGNANPTALVIANNCFQAVQVIGWPESRIILSQVVIYLATSAKSNASYAAINEAIALVKQTGDLPVPLHIRNAPTKLMKSLDYGKDYMYSHNYEGNFKSQEYMPEKIKGTALFKPGNNQRENEIRTRLRNWWNEKYGY